MAILLTIWVLLIIFLAFFNLKYCVCFYMAYMILVPFLNINIGGISLQYNLVNTVIVIGFVVKYYNSLKHIDFRSFKSFIFLYVFYLVMMPLQSFPLSISLNSWRINVMLTLLFPIIVWNIYRFDKTLYKPLKYTFIICIFITLVYGLLLTQIPGLNPYLMLILPINGAEFNDLYAFADDGRVFGRISSVFGHPMTFGLVLCLSIIFIYSISKNMNKYCRVLLLIMCVLNILFCGVRSAIAGTLIGVVMYIFLSKKIKLAAITIIVFICLAQVVQIIPGMEDYVSSIVDFDGKNQVVSGSSKDMRLEQLNGALEEISSSPLIGKGYGWVSNYLSVKGDHPVLLAFESLIFIVLCDNGLLGIIAWLISIYLYYRQVRIYRDQWKILLVLYLTYIIYSCITGEYGYLKYMLLFYTIMLINSEENKVKIKNIRQ